MSTWKRAFLYTVRKKVKTVILFLLLLAMSTFTLTGLSIYKAADNSASSLRQSIGGSIRLELDENNRANWQYQQAAGGTMVGYTGTPITDSIFAKDFEFISGFSFGQGWC